MEWSPNPDALRGGVAVVAGATRGAGRGIAAALGEAGATVVCTGRSSRNKGGLRLDYNRSETIEESAELVTDLGGTGIAVRSRPSRPRTGESLAERIRTDARPYRRARQRHLGRGSSREGLRNGILPSGRSTWTMAYESSARYRHPHNHFPSPSSAADRQVRVVFWSR